MPPEHQNGEITLSAMAQLTRARVLLLILVAVVLLVLVYKIGAMKLKSVSTCAARARLALAHLIELSSRLPSQFSSSQNIFNCTVYGFHFSWV